MFAGSFDAAQVHAKDLGNPGGFAPAAADAVTIAVVEAAEQVSQQSCDDRGTTASGDEANDLPWHGHAPMVVGIALYIAWKSARLWPLRSVGEVANVSMVLDQIDSPVVEAAERGPEMLPPPPPTRPWSSPSVYVGTWPESIWHQTSSHLLSGKPDPDIPQLDEPSTVSPPKKAELPDRQKQNPPTGLRTLRFG